MLCSGFRIFGKLELLFWLSLARIGIFFDSMSNFTAGTLQLLVIVFNAKSPCNIGNADDEIKLVLSTKRLGDQADGSSDAVQCGDEIKSKCSSCDGLFTLEVIQLTRFLLGFEKFFALLPIVICIGSLSIANGVDVLSFFVVFVNKLFDLMMGMSNDEENNGS